LRLPRFRPYFDRVLTHGRGGLAIRSYFAPGDSIQLWHLLDPQGEYLGPLALPPGVDLRYIANDRFLAVLTDSLGVERVLILSADKEDTFRPGPGTG
jgi:hypothetical protein